MDTSDLTQWLGGLYAIVLKDPPDLCVQGILVALVPEQHLTLDKVFVADTNQTYARLDIRADNVKDIIPLQASPVNASVLTGPTVTFGVPPPQPPPEKTTAFHDPAIVSMTRRPELDSHEITSQHHPQPNIGEKRDPVITNPADRMTFSSPDETDATTTAALNPAVKQLEISPPDPAHLETTEDEMHNVTPTGSKVPAGPRTRERRRGPRGGKNNKGAKSAENESPASNARPTNQGKGWRETPILQSTKSFQPFASLKKSQKGRAAPNADNGWASEDVTDVQEAGDFDFQGSLAKFDKRTIFNEMREQDQIDESERLVSHNRLPRPKPGTAGGKNLHYTENVLDIPSSGPKLKETPGDFWKSEADDDHANGSERLSGREGSGRNSRLRGESRMSTTHRSQSRKASATANAGGLSRVNSGQPSSSSAVEGFYTASSNRRIETVTHLQMVVVEGVAKNEFGLTEDLIAENAGRGIVEVAMRALEDPAIKIRATATSPASTSTIVVLVGTGDNHNSGVRAIAAARHLRNRGLHVLVCVVGIEREKKLPEDIRKQIRLFRNFGGTVCSKATLFDQLKQPITLLGSSSQPSVTLIVDALLGLTIPFEELRQTDQATTYELMEWANRNEAFVLSVDIPSGIEPATGKVTVIEGEPLCIQTRYIVALGAPKHGLLKAIEMGDAQADVDQWKLYLADIGLGAAVWRKTATKVRRGIDFDDQWVLDLRYQPHVMED
ncbi:YjeF-related protein N-terminus-domain-containing protein [Xylariomycetidae sp. FL2044]|nr:YjeF-related protein N-terminus-domain-containing protein [Xylariomycetidae sp. FL2044]